MLSLKQPFVLLALKSDKHNISADRFVPDSVNENIFLPLILSFKLTSPGQLLSDTEVENDINRL